MAEKPSLHEVGNCRPIHRRAVLVLKYPDNKHVKAFEGREALSKSARRFFETSVDYWIGDYNQPKRFHGWNKSQFGGEYINCFVFKAKDDNSRHRFYGFLCNPLTKKPNFQVCVLVVYDTKDEDASNTANLEKVLRISNIVEIQSLVTEFFSAFEE